MPSTDDRPADDVAGAAPLDAARLRAVWLDLFGRPPYLAERQSWLGRPIDDLLDEVASPESPYALELWEHWLEEQLYYFFLIDNFRPATERVLALPGQLAEGSIGVRDAVHRIVLSSAFDLRNPGADTFVTVVMEQLLGVVVQDDPRELEIGKALYDGRRGRFLGEMGESQSDVVRIAMADERFLRRFVAREHERLLRAEVRGRQLGEWAQRIEDDPYAHGALLASWLASPAYDARVAAPIVQPNRLFVRTLYVDLLDRLPDADESRRLRDALDGLSDPGPLRSILARLLLDSGEVAVPRKGEIDDPRAWIGALFERLLGRQATEEELDAFAEAFEDPACRPETVLYAIVSHPEYHQF